MALSEVAQSCPTLCDPMDCSLPGFSVHGIFQARVLERVAISFSRGSSWPRDRPQVSCIAGRCFTLWATREYYKNGLRTHEELEDLLEKGMVTHSSILSWRIPWTEEPDGLPSTGSQKVGHDWATNSFWTHETFARNSMVPLVETWGCLVMKWHCC